MDIQNFRIDTVRAFALISIDINAIQRLSQYPKDRVTLESFGVDIRNFTPVIAKEIELEQWVKLLQFYAKKARYIKAKELLADMKKTVKAG